MEDYWQFENSLNLISGSISLSNSIDIEEVSPQFKTITRKLQVNSFKEWNENTNFKIPVFFIISPYESGFTIECSEFKILDYCESIDDCYKTAQEDLAMDYKVIASRYDKDLTEGARKIKEAFTSHINGYNGSF